MKHMPRFSGWTTRIGEFGNSAGNWLAQSLQILGGMVFPFLVGGAARGKRNVSKILLSWGCLAVAVVLVSRPCSSGQRLEIRNWSLPQLVEHLEANQIGFQVVPTQKSGNWSNSIYLTNRTDADWPSLQTMVRSVERIDAWRGVVLIERLSNKPGPQWDVSQWGKYGLQLDRFILFGDEELIRQISQSMAPAQSTCMLRRLLACE
jgi:hypothetical protein